tara:strand:+ start:490 stop:654 length:165 start_codon:yes stop_codon:yes gene_type:complete
MLLEVVRTVPRKQFHFSDLLVPSIKPLPSVPVFHGQVLSDRIPVAVNVAKNILS